MCHSAFVRLCTSTSPPINLALFPLSTHNLCAHSLAHLNCTGFPYDLHVLTSSCCRRWADASFLVRKCSHFSTKLQTTLLNGMQDIPGFFCHESFMALKPEECLKFETKPCHEVLQCCWAMLEMLALSQPLGKLLCTNWSSVPK